MTPILYSYFRSSSAWRVRIGLELKAITYATHAVHLLRDGGEQRAAPFQNDVSPMQQVPALAIDGRVLTQSLPILEYLDETRPNSPLLPADPWLRFKSRELAEVINAGIQPVQNLSVLQRLDSTFGADADQKRRWASDAIIHGFTALEALAEPVARTYLVGDAVTLADLYLVPQMYNARRFGVDLAAFPLLSRIDSALTALPAFARAHAHAQPDTPDELRGT